MTIKNTQLLLTNNEICQRIRTTQSKEK